MTKILKALYDEKREVEAKRNERYYQLAISKSENRNEPVYKLFLEEDIERLEASIAAIENMLDDLENEIHVQEEMEEC